MKNGEKIEKQFRHRKWTRARLLITQALKKAPQDHWLLTRLAMTYYEETNYRKALEISIRAVKLAPKCPLVQWDYACAIDMVGNHRQAITIWKRLLSRGERAIAYGEHGEGLRWARSLLNDCRYRIGLAYRKQGKKQLSLKYLRDHLANRSRGLSSIYSLVEVRRQINHILERMG